MPDATLRLRRAAPADAAVLAALGERTFRDTFGPPVNRAADVDAYVAATYSPDRQGWEIADPGHRVLVAEDAQGLVGFALLALGGAPPPGVPDDATVELMRLYVRADRLGAGAGAALMGAALDEAAAHGARALWLGVWEHNARARAFYARWGFRDVGAHVFLLGADRQTDRLLVRQLP